MRNFLIFLFIVIVLGVWVPWTSKEEAAKQLRESTAVIDNAYKSCTFALDDESVHKVFFGYLGTVSYDCNLLDNPSFVSGKNYVFVSIFNVVINMPHPIIQ